MGEILVLSATAFEQQVLREQMVKGVRREVAAREWVSGRINEREVLLLATGIGAVNTAHALTCVLQTTRPEWVLQVGVGIWRWPMRSGMGIWGFVRRRVGRGRS